MCISVVETKILKTYFWLSDIALAFFVYIYIYLYIMMYINTKNLKTKIHNRQVLHTASTYE